MIHVKGRLERDIEAEIQRLLSKRGGEVLHPDFTPTLRSLVVGVLNRSGLDEATLKGMTKDFLGKDTGQFVTWCEAIVSVANQHPIPRLAVLSRT
jgi:hypothetical protein